MPAALNRPLITTTTTTTDNPPRSVSGGWELPFDHPGMFIAGGETSQPAPFLTELRRVLGEATQSPPPPDKLLRAKQEKLNSCAWGGCCL